MTVRSVQSNSAPQQRRERDQNPQHNSLAFRGINTVFKELIYKKLRQIKNAEYFKWPSEMLGDPTKRDLEIKCSYHIGNGHSIEDCRALKGFLEELVRQGRLKYFIDESRKVNNE